MKQVAKLDIIPAQSLGFFFLNSNDTNFLIHLFSLISRELGCFMADIKLTIAARLSSWAPVSFRIIFWCLTILRILVWSLRKKKRKAIRKKFPTKENAARFYFCHSNVNSARKSSRILCSRTHLKCPSSNP